MYTCTLFDEFHYNPQVVVGGRDGVPIGTLEYTVDTIIIIVPVVYSMWID